MYLSFFFSSRRRHTRYIGDWSSDVCSSDLDAAGEAVQLREAPRSVRRRTTLLRERVARLHVERDRGGDARLDDEVHRDPGRAAGRVPGGYDHAVVIGAWREPGGVELNVQPSRRRAGARAE